MLKNGDRALCNNYDKDISTIKILKDLGYEKGSQFSPRDLAESCGYLNPNGSPMVQKLARSLQRLVDTKFLICKNVTTPLGKIIGKRYVVVGEFDNYIGMRKEEVKKREQFLEAFRKERENKRKEKSSSSQSTGE